MRRPRGRDELFDEHACLGDGFEVGDLALRVELRSDARHLESTDDVRALRVQRLRQCGERWLTASTALGVITGFGLPSQSLGLAISFFSLSLSRRFGIGRTWS